MEAVPTFTLEGSRIDSLDAFWDEICVAVNGPGGYFARSLDALDDALGGGMGTPDDGRCTFVWVDADHSRAALGYADTVRQLERRLERCHPTNRDNVRADLQRARRHEGPTTFDWILSCFEGSAAQLVLR